MIMSEHEETFIGQLRKEFDSFKEDVDRRYVRMQTFLISVIIGLLGTTIAVGFTHFTRDGETRQTVAILQENQRYVLQNAVSQKAINDLIVSFDNQIKVMEKFLPKDVKGAIEEFDRVSSNFRSYITVYQSGLNPRGAKEEPKKN